jgi:hypothetical protein
VLGEVMDSVAAEEKAWWVATGSEVAAWWLARRAAGVTVGRGPEGDVELLVSAPPDAPLEGAWLSLVIPDEKASLAPVVDGLPVGFARAAWGLAVPLGEVPAGGTRRIRLVETGGS